MAFSKTKNIDSRGEDMRFGQFLWKFFRFFYFWMLFFVSVEIFVRFFVTGQKIYQVSAVWVYVALVLNAVLIANYLRKVFYQKKNIQTS